MSALIRTKYLGPSDSKGKSSQKFEIYLDGKAKPSWTYKTWWHVYDRLMKIAQEGKASKATVKEPATGKEAAITFNTGGCYWQMDNPLAWM